VHEGEHLLPRQRDRDVGGPERQDDEEPAPVASGHGDDESSHEDVGEEEDECQVPSSRATVEHGQREPRGQGVALHDGRHAEQFTPRERIADEPLVESDQPEQDREAGHADRGHDADVDLPQP
jgi:hypothetical protein